MMVQAISADRKNPLPMYQKAQILLSLERYEEALEELEHLIAFAPRESSVYALMGNIYKQLNIHDKAMFYFGLALDLKPPAADVAMIKVLISMYTSWQMSFICISIEYSNFHIYHPRK